MESSFKNMTLCLLVICLVCSALLAGVYSLTKEPISKAEQQKLSLAIAEVLPQFDSLGVLSTVEMGGKSFEYYPAYSVEGNFVGAAINSSAVGFGGSLEIMVGVDAEGNVYNTSVLSHSETPGLGAKCTEGFKDQFKGWNASEKKLSVKKDGGEVDAITAATITSRAYVQAIDTAIKVYGRITDEQ